jgi:NADH dehydrogenase
LAWDVVISGGGFGGLYAARQIERTMPRHSTRITLVNDVNFLLYTPFLPEAAAGTLEPRHVVTPLRDVLEQTRLILAATVGRDRARRTVTVRDQEGDEQELRYDRLLVAHGSVSRVLPVPGLEEHAVGFKSLADAIWLRNHVIQSLELADASEDPSDREELLTYIFVGGGYAGLEALAELQDFAADALELYPRARLHGMRWVLVEAAGRVLPEIDLELAEYALEELRSRGIDIRLGTTVEEVSASSARLSTGETIPTRTVVWTAGVTPHPSTRGLGLPLDERGRIRVDRELRVEGEQDVWAVGDSAAVPDPEALHLQDAWAGREPRPLQGSRQDRAPEDARLPCLVVCTDLPREPASRHGPQGARRHGLDRRAPVRARHRRGRLDRPSHPAEAGAGAAAQPRRRRTGAGRRLTAAPG